jgi:hypothetical protein
MGSGKLELNCYSNVCLEALSLCLKIHMVMLMDLELQLSNYDFHYRMPISTLILFKGDFSS